MDKNRLMDEIKSYDFTIVELALYLDTHPNDTKALDIYNSIKDKLFDLKEKYEANFGPLNIYGVKTSKHKDIIIFVPSFPIPLFLSEKSSGLTTYIIRENVTLNTIKTANKVYILPANSAISAWVNTEVLAIPINKSYSVEIKL